MKHNISKVLLAVVVVMMLLGPTIVPTYAGDCQTSGGDNCPTAHIMGNSQ